MAPKTQHDANRLLPNEYNPAMALAAAESFYNAAERCNEHRSTGGPFEWLPVPAIVNYALSCEVYMKSLLINIEAKAYTEHNLLKLFNALPDDIQAEVQKTIDCSKTEFLKMLENTSDLFIECRYVYEFTALRVNLVFLQELSASLKVVSHRVIM